MAEGWSKRLKGDVLEVYSAGIEKQTVDPISIKVMAEVGVDISKQRSKNIDEVKDKHFDYVVTICDNANEKCPVFPRNAKRIHHAFDNPRILAKKLSSMDDIIALYRRVRDEIKDFILKMPENLSFLKTRTSTTALWLFSHHTHLSRIDFGIFSSTTQSINPNCLIYHLF